MATGDAILNSGVNDWSKGEGVRVEKWHLLDSITATDNGAWVRISGASEAVISIISASVSTGADIQIRGYVSEDGSQPAASEHGFLIGSEVVVSASEVVDFAPLAGGQTTEWIKARCSDYTDGTYDVILLANFRK